MPTTDSDGAANSRIQSVETSLRIVRTLRELGGGRVADIVDETGLSKGAVYKHLSTLMAHDFVVKRGSQYRLGFQFLDYGGWLRSRYVGAEIIKAKIREVAAETNEVALFAIRENDRTVTLFRENGNRGVSTRTRLGRRLYFNQTASGKAILSQLPESEVESILDSVGLPRATENTITERSELFERLELIRERGYAFNREESTEGLVAVSVPLVSEDTVIGACSVAGPRHRIDEERINDEVVGLLLSVVNELELNITHSQNSLDLFGS